MKSRKTILSLYLTLVILIVSLSLGIQMIIADNDAPPGVTVKELASENDDIGLHQISEEEKAKVLEIALADARFQEITNGLAYQIGRIDNWIMTGDYATKIGGVVEVILDTPHAISYEWPGVSFETDGDVLYQKLSRQAEVTVGTLYVGVDLKAGEVIKILPIPPDK